MYKSTTTFASRLCCSGRADRKVKVRSSSFLSPPPPFPSRTPSSPALGCSDRTIRPRLCWWWWCAARAVCRVFLRVRCVSLAFFGGVLLPGELCRAARAVASLRRCACVSAVRSGIRCLLVLSEATRFASRAPRNDGDLCVPLLSSVLRSVSPSRVRPICSGRSRSVW
jgi:hypothetical protein